MQPISTDVLARQAPEAPAVADSPATPTAQVLTVFRSRLHAAHQAEYDHHVQVTAALAEKMPGFLGHKMFVADDGERVTLVEFASMAQQRAWSLSPEHKAAAIAGRRGFYSEYQIQICTVERQSRFTSPARAPA